MHLGVGFQLRVSLLSVCKCITVSCYHTLSLGIALIIFVSSILPLPDIIDLTRVCYEQATLVRQGSSTDMETLKSNLESAIERENDLKEQLKYAEEEARMLRKRLRVIEHENEALTKQLKKLSQIAHAKSKSPSGDRITSESIQTEVIQLENTELRANNDELHKEIESLQSQVR